MTNNYQTFPTYINENEESFNDAVIAIVITIPILIVEIYGIYLFVQLLDGGS
jgi:hypothetical protein